MPGVIRRIRKTKGAPMQENNNFKLGLFVTISLLVFAAAVLAMGVFDSLFKSRAHLATFVEESVQGLAGGSAVKFRGVPIGKVSDITIIMESRTVRIDMEIDLSKFKTKLGKNIFTTPGISAPDLYKYLHSEIDKGLRCRIEPDGITGNKYIEMDFFKDMDTRLGDAEFQPGLRNGVFFMPSTPSLMSSLRFNMTEILANIAMIDFKKISQEAVALLERANKTLDDPRIDRLLGDAETILKNASETVNTLNGTLTPEKLDLLMTELNGTVRSIRELSDGLEKTLETSKIPQTTASIRELSDTLSTGGSNIRMTILKLNEALDAMTDLIQYINDNPSSVLHGKGREEK